MEPGVINQHLFPFIEVMPQNVLIMPLFGTFFVKLSVFIRFQSKLMKLIELVQKLSTCMLQIKIKELQGLVGLVF